MFSEKLFFGNFYRTFYHQVSILGTFILTVFRYLRENIFQAIRTHLHIFSTGVNTRKSIRADAVVSGVYVTILLKTIRWM